MRPYYYDGLPGSVRLPHDSGESVDIGVVAAMGLKYTYVPVPEPLTDDFPLIDVICRERGYILRGYLTVTKEDLGEIYESKLEAFRNEHMHEEEEIRYVLRGSGYFDIRETPTDRWIRCAVSPGDLIVVPPGIYHRFILDDGNMIKALMLFTEAPRWSYHNRGKISEANEYRAGYLKSIETH